MKALISVGLATLCLVGTARSEEITVGPVDRTDCARVCDAGLVMPRCEHAYFGQGTCVLTDHDRPAPEDPRAAIYSGRAGRWLTEGAGSAQVDPYDRTTTDRTTPDRPALDRIFSSNYGDIHWSENYYGTPSKTIHPVSTEWDPAAQVWIVRGNWGRTNGSSSGGFEFRFDSPCSFAGWWWYAGGARKGSPNWTGSCK